jgi:hypothetical protein
MFSVKCGYLKYVVMNVVLISSFRKTFDASNSQSRMEYWQQYMLFKPCGILGYSSSRY